MNGTLKFAAVLAACYGLIGAFLAFCTAALWPMLEVRERAALGEIVAGQLPLIATLAVLGLVTVGLAAHVLYRRYALLPARLAGDARVILGGNADFRVQPAGPRALRALAEAINGLAARAADRAAEVRAGIETATTKLDEERNRLAALMSELTLGVLVCNRDGRILLYNGRARSLLEPRAAGDGYVGLGRSVFPVVERNLLAHALERLDEQLARSEPAPVARFVTAAPPGRLLRLQVAPVRARGGQPAGFVITLEDVTASLASEASRDALLRLLTEGNRSAIANVRAAVETMTSFPEMDAWERGAFLGIVREETARMEAHLEQAVREHGDVLKSQWPLEEMNGLELLQLVQRRIKARLGLDSVTESVDAAVWLKVDSYWLTFALAAVAQRLQEEIKVPAIRFRLAAGERRADLDFLWQGGPVPAAVVARWEGEPLRFGEETASRTLREVLERHGGEAWCLRGDAAGTSCYRITLPLAPGASAAGTAAAAPTGDRPEYYDFDLFDRPEYGGELDGRLLSALSYTVFDTETTGLDPSAGDEIISIGAVRMVNGRLLRHEVFDQLVDPQRPMPPEAVAVHGIESSVLAGQPVIAGVLPGFARFCEETVLVAHNAAFDLRFLQLKEASTGVRFSQPVLDTLLLSAVLHPTLEEHGLEALAQRYGVSVMGRHTALGDALVTGEIFLGMIPRLAEIGIHTLKDARDACQKTYYSRLRY